MADTAAAPQAAERSGGVFRQLKSEFGHPERRTAYLMSAPAFVIIIVIALFPILYAVWLSFRSATVTTTGEFIGLQNYGSIFGDPAFRLALWNTSIFTISSVFFEVIFGIAIALGLNRVFIGRGPVRAISLVPWAFPTVISAAMWRLMYQDQVGIMAFLAEKIGLFTEPILSQRGSMMVAAIIVDIWKTTPFMAILLLAGLQVIPEDVYEAARVDGASPWQQFTRITLPLVKPALLVALLFRTLDAWRIYDLFWVMTDRQLESLSTFVYKGVKISQLQFATGNTAAVFIFLSSLAIAVIFIKVLGARATE